MVQINEKHRKNSHLFIHCPMSEGVSKVSERCERTSERCERTGEWTSKWPSTAVCILGYSGPQCILEKIP